MTAINTSLYLNSSGQAQLAKLKQANQVPLTRVDSRINALRAQQTPLNKVNTEVGELRAVVVEAVTPPAGHGARPVQDPTTGVLVGPDRLDEIPSLVLGQVAQMGLGYLVEEILAALQVLGDLVDIVARGLQARFGLGDSRLAVEQR